MTLVGVTGQTGAGKTTFCDIFRDIGAKVINADQIGHQLHQDGGIKAKLVEAFGEEILDAAGNVDRTSLGNIVFENRKNREMLDRIIQKPLIDVIEARVYSIQEDGFPGVVALDAALLPKWKKLCKSMDFIVLIDAPTWQRVNRLEEERGISQEQAEKRIAALDELYGDFYPHIDYNVKNSGNLHEFRAKVVKVWLDIKSQVGRQ